MLPSDVVDRRRDGVAGNDREPVPVRIVLVVGAFEVAPRDAALLGDAAQVGEEDRFEVDLGHRRGVALEACEAAASVLQLVDRHPQREEPALLA